MASHTLLANRDSVLRKPALPGQPGLQRRFVLAVEVTLVLLGLVLEEVSIEEWLASQKSLLVAVEDNL